MMPIYTTTSDVHRRTSRLLLAALALALLGTASVPADQGLAAAWVNRGDTLAASGDYPGALDAYRTALRAEPGYVAAYLGIGQTRLLSGAYSEAFATFKQILAGNPNEARAVRGVAAARMGLKQYPQAIESWRRALQLNPTDTAAMIRAGVCYLTLRRPADALPSLEKACELAPDDADAFYQLGRAYLLLKRPVPAGSALTKAVNLRASFYDAERLLLPVQVKSGLYISAQVFARDILSKAPNDKIALTNLALSYEGLGLSLDAARVYLTLAKVSPPNQAVLLLLRVADTAEHESDRKLAREALEQAGAIDPTNPAIFARLGRSYEKAGDHDTALRYLRLAVTSSQARPEYLVEYGRALEAIGDTTGALAAFHRAIGRDPADIDARLEAAKLCEQTGWLEKAEEHWTIVVAAKPSEREPRLSRIRVLERMGRRGEALAEVAELLRVQYDCDLAVKAAELAIPLGMTIYAERILRIAAPMPGSKSLSARLKLAELLTSEKRTDEARAICGRAVTEFPDDPDCRCRLAQALLADKRFAEAADALRPAHRRDGTREDVAQFLAEALLGCGDLSAVIDVLEAALPAHPDSKVLYDLFMSVSARANDLTRASDFLAGLLADGKADELAARRVAEIAKQLRGGVAACDEMAALARAHPDRPAIGWVAAQAALDAGRPLDAEAIYVAMAEKPETCERALVALCQVRIDGHRLPQAVDAAMSLLGRREDCARALAFLEELKTQPERLSKCAELLRALVIALPGSADFHCTLVDMYATVQRLTEIEALYAADCALHPDDLGIAAGHLRALQLVHRPEAILAAVVRLQDSRRLAPRARTIYAEALAVSGRADEAKTILEGVAAEEQATEGRVSAKNALRLAVLAAEGKDYDLALWWYVTALKAGDDSGQAERAIPALCTAGQATVDAALDALSDVWNAGEYDAAVRVAKALQALPGAAQKCEVWLKWHEDGGG